MMGNQVVKKQVMNILKTLTNDITQTVGIDKLNIGRQRGLV